MTLLNDSVKNSPCRDYLINLDADRLAFGHLSLSHGLMPKRLITNRLPESFSPWEEIAEQIPALFFSQNTQVTIEKMPTLPADSSSLADEHLPRAAIILGIIASAYWRHGVDTFFSLRTSDICDYLPPCILEPWKTICGRAGREDNIFQSFDDLMLNNFMFVDDALTGEDGNYKIENTIIENIDTLVKSFGNQPERVFYMSFVEIHAMASPIVQYICDIQDAILASDQESIDIITDRLMRITECVKRCTKTLLKISANPRHETFCDPILWSKTVAIFAVPPSTYPQGATSGASVPFVHILDALIDRTKYDSHYGEYTKTAGNQFLPKEVARFLPLIQSVSLRKYINSLNSIDQGAYQTLSTAFNNLVNTYAGKDGFLDKHTAKVFNYLGIATLVGRNQSTSGHERYISTETWVEVSRDLAISMEERDEISDNQASASPIKPTHQRDLHFDNLDTVTVSQLAEHHHLDNGWISINGYVFDVSGFINRHPGGSEIIIAHLGRDATKIFPLVSAHLTDSVSRTLSKLVVGQLQEKPNNPLFDQWYRLLDHLLRSYGVINMQYKHEVPFNFKVLFHSQTHIHFCKEHIRRILDLICYDDNYALLELAGKIDTDKVQWHDKLKCDLSGNIPYHEKLEILHLISAYEHGDLILVDELITKVRWVISNMERSSDISEDYLYSQRFSMLLICLRWFNTLETLACDNTNAFLRSNSIGAIA